MGEEDIQQATQTVEEGSDGQSVEVQEVQLPEGREGGGSGPAGQIDVLLRTTIPVSVRLGEVTVPVQKLLQMQPGAVMKLDKQVGEPLDLFIRDTKFAEGQLVVAGDRLGVRITEVLSRPQQ